ncbi:hypothetical protein MPER_00949, partial [Moniliophthora perniciosa FA553]
GVLATPGSGVDSDISAQFILPLLAVAKNKMMVKQAGAVLPQTPLGVSPSRDFDINRPTTWRLARQINLMHIRKALYTAHTGDHIIH